MSNSLGLSLFLFIYIMQSPEAKALTFTEITCNNPVYLKHSRLHTFTVGDSLHYFLPFAVFQHFL